MWVTRAPSSARRSTRSCSQSPSAAAGCRRWPGRSRSMATGPPECRATTGSSIGRPVGLEHRVVGILGRRCGPRRRTRPPPVEPLGQQEAERVGGQHVVLADSTSDGRRGAGRQEGCRRLGRRGAIRPGCTIHPGRGEQCGRVASSSAPPPPCPSGPVTATEPPAGRPRSATPRHRHWVAVGPLDHHQHGAPDRRPPGRAGHPLRLAARTPTLGIGAGRRRRRAAVRGGPAAPTGPLRDPARPSGRRLRGPAGRPWSPRALLRPGSARRRWSTTEI